MAKQGMKRPDGHGFGPEKNKKHKKNDAPPVPELQGKVKSGKKKADSFPDRPLAPAFGLFYSPFPPLFHGLLYIVH